MPTMRPFKNLVSELDLADDFAVFSVDIPGRDRIRRHARRNNHKIDLIEQPRRKIAARSGRHYASSLKISRLSRPALDVLFIVQSDDRASIAKNFADSMPDFPAPRTNAFYRRSPSFFHRSRRERSQTSSTVDISWQDPYLSFNVDKLNKANKIATITNRKTILGSFHPDISK